MTLDWSSLKGYAIPTFSLIAPVLNRVSQEKADLVLVAPVWQAHHLFPVQKHSEKPSLRWAIFTME